MDEPTPPRTVPPAFMALIAGAIAFICLSGRSLPELVASHFDGAGRPNGYMPRGPYLAIMLAITALVPLFIVVFPNLALSRPGVRINLLNRSYWLAPERREALRRRLSHQMAVFATLVILFLCYTQWLVVRANALTPPSLDSRALLIGLAVFLVCTLSWALQMLWSFRKGS